MIRQISKKKGFSHYLKSKIVATVGPASANEKTLLQMVKNGMRIVRLNFSHGTHEDHLKVINLIRKISIEEKTPITVLQDLCGPKIRLAKMDTPVELKKNKSIKLAIDHSIQADLYTEFLELPHFVQPGDAILLDDGYIELSVTAVEESLVVCRVVVPGTAKSRKGINLPDVKMSIPVFTEKDKDDFIFGLRNGVDMAAMSFVESGENYAPVQKIMEKIGRTIPIIAKIERPTSLQNIDGIISAFDGIMIARGDLGVEVPPEEVPTLQKQLINLANDNNKFVITATQMLESMIDNPRPTRAEASDVSNAILDGTDAVMLSGETAAGKYPVKAVNMMKRISLIAENSNLYRYILSRHKSDINLTEAIARSAVEIAEDLKAKYIMVFTLTGYTALLLSKCRPHCPILAFTSDIHARNKMAAYWGVSPHLIQFTPQTDDMIHIGEDHVKAEELAKPGDLVVTVAGMLRLKGATNMLRVSKIT